MHRVAAMQQAAKIVIDRVTHVTCVDYDAWV